MGLPNRLMKPRPARAAALARAALALCLVAGVAPAYAQEAPAPEATAAEAPAAEDFSRPMGPEDPYNRGTPRGSLYGFIVACRAGDYERAANFLDLRRLPPEDAARGPELARRFKVALDRTLWVDFLTLSDSNAGHGEDGLPASRDRLGRIETGRGEVDLLLQRVPREDGTRIWKIAAATVAQIDALHAEFGPGPLERWLPAVFFERQFLDLQLWQWVGLLLLPLLAWGISNALATLMIRALHRLVARRAGTLDERIVRAVRGPVRLTMGVAFFSLSILPLGLALGALEWLRVPVRVLLVLAAASFVFRLIDLGTLVLRRRLERRGQAYIVPVLLPSQRVVKGLILVFGGLGILSVAGVNITAAVAGIGVGGIAVALAAQKTIENLFGGVTLFADRPVRVGDFCRYGDKVGTVEEIGLRSTRIRSLDRTVISIPNADFSNLHLENFAKRDQMRLYVMIGVRYETTPDQMRYLLAKLRELLLAHPRVTPDPARVRFVGFGAYSLDIEVFAYTNTSDWSEFLQIREDVYLRMMEVVAEAGTGFAFPSSTMYLGRDEGLEEQKTRHAEERVRAWRQQGDLPFPHFPEAFSRENENTLDWPPAGSPGAAKAADEGGPR